MDENKRTFELFATLLQPDSNWRFRFSPIGKDIKQKFSKICVFCCVTFNELSVKLLARKKDMAKMIKCRASTVWHLLVEHHRPTINISSQEQPTPLNLRGDFRAESIRATSCSALSWWCRAVVRGSEWEWEEGWEELSEAICLVGLLETGDCRWCHLKYTVQFSWCHTALCRHNRVTSAGWWWAEEGTQCTRRVFHRTLFRMVGVGGTVTEKIQGGRRIVVANTRSLLGCNTLIRSSLFTWQTLMDSNTSSLYLLRARCVMCCKL